MRVAAILVAILLTAILLTATVHAETLIGRVVGITDGDTITLLVEGQQIKVRISGIDAPEGRQAFGERSKQALSAMAFKKDARLECHKTDRYKRKVCKVWVQPADCPSCGLTLDIGHAQVLAGMAWWFREYAKEQTPDDRGRYGSSEEEARLRKHGLWQDANPVPPWDWRRGDRPAQARQEQPPRAAAARPDQQPTSGPPKPYCDRKDIAGKNHAEIVCEWR